MPIFNAGTRRIELLRKYIQEIFCNYCETKTEHLLIIYCKAFVLGLFYPFKWWASDKESVIICKKCSRETLITENENHFPAKIHLYDKETKIPFRYKFPTIAFIGSLIILGSLMLFGFFSIIVDVLTPINTKLRGKWRNDTDMYSMYVYSDKQFTIIGQDTIIYGKYIQNGGTINFPFIGGENEIHKNQSFPLRLKNAENMYFTFEKIGKTSGYDELFRKENNLWRTRSQSPESNEEIRNKVLGYLQFEEKKLEKALQDNIEFVEIDPNAAVVLAMNGIQVNYYSERKWRYLFNNDESWGKANEILHSEFPKKGTINQSEENIFKRNLHFLKAYIQNVKTSDLKYLDNQQ